jgi:hypothetical protein
MRPHSGRRDASRVIADGAGYLTIQTVRAAQTARGYLAVLPALLGNRDPTRCCSTRLKPFLSCYGESRNRGDQTQCPSAHHRLRGIGELAGCDLQSADTRAVMWLPIKARGLPAFSAGGSR